MSDDRTVLERQMQRVELRPFTLEGFHRRRERSQRNRRIRAGVVALVVAAAAAGALVRAFSFGLPAETPAGLPAETPGGPSAETPASEGEEGFIGLPPEGATPTTLERSELVLQLEGGALFRMVWVYADGRMIWARPFEGPQGSIGLFEQRLTPEGVEFLRSSALSTGLFQRDLDLVREDDAPFLSIQVRDGDGLVRVTWAWRGALRDPDPREATPKQAAALRWLQTLITDPASWPASAWEDQETREYVPATYAICSRGFPKQVDPARVLALLPEEARNLLGSDFGLGDEGRDCAEVMTEEARTLAEIFDAAGIDSKGRGLPSREVWLRYVIADPRAGNEVWINFEPVLPHGEPTWLGPG